MKNPLVLISITLLGVGSGPAYGQQSAPPNAGKIDATSVPAKEGPRVATPDQEVEIKRLIEKLVIGEKEQQIEAAEKRRTDKARAKAEKDENSDDDPYDPDNIPLAVQKAFDQYSKIRDNAFERLTEYKDLAFPILATHLDDKRPSLMMWNHTFADTVGTVCSRVIHNQLTKHPEGYSEYGLYRIGRDGQYHEQTFYTGNPYEKSGGLGKWLQQNQNLSYIEKRIKCLSWMLDAETKIGVIDPHGYYVNIVPLELEILELKAGAGQDVTNELARVRKLMETKPANQVPKELLPDGPLPEIEKKHALQLTSAMLKACPDGHTALRDIPILHGTFPLLTKTPADWNDEDKALSKRRDAKEIILGGEADCAEDPRFQVTCLTCGYFYRIQEAPDIGANWIKNGHQFTDFTTPFSSYAKSLPFTGMPDTEISVEVNKKGRVVAELIKVTISSDQKAAMVAKLEKWIANNRFKRSMLHIETPPRPRLYEQHLEKEELLIFFDVHTDPEGNKTCITFSLESLRNS